MSSSCLTALQEQLNKVFVIDDHASQPNSVTKTKESLDNTLSAMFDKISDLDAENRRLNVMIHFVKGEYTSFKKKEKKKRKKTESKKTRDIAIQEPCFDREVDLTTNGVEEVDNKDCTTLDELNGLSDPVSFGLSFDSLPDPRSPVEPDLFESVQNSMIKKLSKKKLKPPPLPPEESEKSKNWKEKKKKKKVANI